MRAFTYEKPSNLEAARKTVVEKADDNQPPTLSSVQYIAGGTNLADYMRLNVARPERVIDLNGLTEPYLRNISISDDGIRLGALVRMAEAEENETIKSRFPILSDSLRLAASAQIRNMATLAGNILQRTRCEYFRETSWPCNKRVPGSGCSALEGINRQHAVLGVGDDCIATYHGDFAQALIALDANVEVLGAAGPRRIAFSDFHKRPAGSPHIETVLAADEIVVAIHVPARPWPRSRYVKVRDRASYAFALASAGVALDLDGDVVSEVRIALGGVATVPWRAKDAEKILRGLRLDDSTAMRVAEAAFSSASARKHNAFKIPLGKQTLIRALLEARDMRASP